MALARGSVGAMDFTPRHVSDNEVQEISQRVHVTPDESGRLGRLGTIATIRTRGGAELTFERDGSEPLWAQDPAEQWERLRAKFESLVGPVLGGRAREFATRIGELADSREIRPLLRGLIA
jgi:hypothetical protein